MFQFAPRKMVESQATCDIPQEEVCSEGDMVYGNEDVRSTNSASSAPLSPLVMIESGADDPDFPLSPPIMRTQSYDEALFDLRKVPPEKIATQLTLIDLNLFKAIRMTELVNANWTKKEKATLAPNVVAFTQRFNHTSFWVVREILNEPLAKARADIIAQFIKISKKLFELNNIHSLKAMLSALQSAAIYRLSQSWKHVPKKDRASFERLDEFLSINDNWKTLRAHMDEAKLPCIPHLGLYLTDLCFLNSTPSSEHKEDTIRNMIAYFQNSTYDALVPEVHIQKYLLHKRYIDELQKFYEEDNYKLSQEREPNQVSFHKPRSVSTAPSMSTAPSPLRISKSYEDILSPFSKDTPTPLNKDEATRDNIGSLSDITVRVDQHSPTLHPVKKKNSTLPKSFRNAPPKLIDFKSSKPHGGKGNSASSLSGHLLSPVDIPEGRGVVTVSPGFKRKFTRGHKKASSLGSNVLQMLGVVKHSSSSPASSCETSPRSSPSHSRSLIDDTPLNASVPGLLSPAGSVGNGSVSSDSSDESGEEEEEALYKKLEDVDEVEIDYLQARLVMEGPLKRNMIKSGGKRVSFVKKWSKVWAQLTDSALIFFPSKPKHRKTSKVVRTKGTVLRGWRVTHKDEKNNEKSFVMFSDSGVQMKFKASSSHLARTWVQHLEKVIRGEEEREKRKAEESLIIL